MLCLQAQTANYKEQEGERKYPLEFETPYVRENTISVSMPVGYGVKELPEGKTFAVDNLMEYTISFKEVNSKLVVRTTETLNASFLKPEMFDKVLAFKKNIVQAEDIALIVTRKE